MASGEIMELNKFSDYVNVYVILNGLDNKETIKREIECLVRIKLVNYIKLKMYEGRIENAYYSLNSSSKPHCGDCGYCRLDIQSIKKVSIVDKIPMEINRFYIDIVLNLLEPLYIEEHDYEEDLEEYWEIHFYRDKIISEGLEEFDKKGVKYYNDNYWKDYVEEKIKNS